MKQYLNKLSAILLTVTLFAGIILIPGITASAATIGTGTLVTFGQYPQTSVINQDKLDVLNSKKLDWKSYNYYVGGQPNDCMEYADISDVFETGDKYRVVRIRQYRPYDATHSPCDAEHSNQDDYGYYYNMDYWFKYEPLVWKVLDPDTGLMVTENIIDSQTFHNVRYVKYNEWENGYGDCWYGDKDYSYYASNWAHSSLRAWMNNDFYNTAFGAESSYIRKSSLTTPSGWDYEFDADPTSDKVFLLSADDYQDWQERYGVTLDGPSTDYAYSQGGDDQGWFTRNPAMSDALEDYEVLFYVDEIHGIRAALKINDLESAVSNSVIKPVYNYKLVNNGPKGTIIEDDPIPDHTEHDDVTGVEISYTNETYDKGIELDVTEVSEGDSYESLNKEKGNFEFKIYDIKTKSKDAEVQPNGTVLVRLPIPANYDRIRLCVYHVTNDGTVVKMEMWIDGDYACFEVSHFSAYALVDESKTVAKYGDVDGNGQILANDARIALRASAKLETLDGKQRYAADVNGDGQVLAGDARQILRYSAKLQKEFEKA